MENEKNNNLFIIILFVVVLALVLFLPKIYKFIEKQKLPKVEKTEVIKEEKKEITEDILETVHYPKMRNSIYDFNTYYSLEKFTISNMSNNDILYNAFLDIYEGNMINSNVTNSCSNISKEFNKDYIELRIKNILGKNISYTLSSFYVPEDSGSKYIGDWTYDSQNSRFIYKGLCQSKATDTKYYNLEELIKVEYEENDLVAYYYVGFAKVIGNKYTIYSDANMTKELLSGDFVSEEELNNIFKQQNKNNKKIYKYLFKNNLCSYDEYCLYEGKWVDGI